MASEGGGISRAVFGAPVPDQRCSARVDGPASPKAPLPLGGALRDLVLCGRNTGCLLVRGRIHQPVDHVGRRIVFADGTAATVYRETVVERPPPAQPAVLVVRFRLRRVRTERLHALFRLESELNTVLFAGFPGLISKLWLGHDGRSMYRGLYQWDDPELARSYARALWWPLAVVSEPESIDYRVLPGVWRDQLLAHPGRIALETAGVDRDVWWLPVGTDGPGR